MSKFCTNCGATLEDDAVFCPECGTRFDTVPAANEAPAPEVRPELQEAERPQPEAVKPEQVQYTAPPAPAPVPAPAPAEAPAQRSKEVSTAGYFWLMLLFAIPVVGFIAMLIFAFAVKNKNLRNFARAHVVWIVVALILAILLWIILKVVLKVTGVEIDWESIVENLRNAFPFWN